MKKNIILLVIILANFISGFAQQKNATKRLSDNERMAWWRDAKFGMFIHWGLYAIPAGEYKGETVKGNAEWIMDKLDIPVKEYEKFSGQFNPVKFDADAWVATAKNAGMKYIVLTSKHHEGFALWDSKITDYDIMDASPFKRDIIKELAEACKKADIKFCFYHSITDWHHPDAQAPLFPNYNAGQKDQTISNPNFPKYYKEYLKPQVKELLTNYGDIGVVWFDGEWIADYTSEMAKDMYAFIKELQPNTIVNNRVDKGRTGMSGMDKEGNFAGDFGTPEKEIPDTGISTDWESCLTMNNTWGFKKSDHNWKSNTELIHSLIEIVSKGGNLLLNVGPTSEGVIPNPSLEGLTAMGNWMNKNKESIYGASASPYEKPTWGRYTVKKNAIYAHVFDWPEDGKLIVNKNIKARRATLLAQPKSRLKMKMTDAGLGIDVPKVAPDGIATVIKIELLSDEDWANLKKYKPRNMKLEVPANNENRVVFMGNSITEKWDRYDPNFFASNPYINRGISGQTTAQMLLRFRQDVIDLKPKVVVISAGTNDIAGNRGPITVDEIASNIFSMAELAESHGIKVILASVLPAINYSWSPSIDPVEKISKLNGLIKDYTQKHHMIYLDYYTPMVDENKGLKKEYGRDTVHPSAEGYKVMEPLAKEAISKALKTKNRIKNEG